MWIDFSESNNSVTFYGKTHVSNGFELSSMKANLRFLIVAPFVLFSWFFVEVGLTQERSTNESAADGIDTACQNISLQPPNRSFTAEGGNTFINVDHESNCTFTATSNAPWLRVTSVQNSDYGGTVYYSVAPYSAIGFTGQDFVPGEPIVVYLGQRGGQPLLRVAADGSGQFGVRSAFNLPDLPHGDQQSDDRKQPRSAAQCKMRGYRSGRRRGS